MLQDLLDQLIWPKLFRAPRLALAPGRVGIAFFTLLLLALLWQLPTLWITGPGPLELATDRVHQAMDGFGRAAATGTVDPLLTAFGDLLFRAPAAMFSTHPVTTLILLLPSLWIWCVGFGAISRSAACEFSREILITWPEALGFSLSRWASLVAAVIAPLLLVLLIAFAIAAGGAALLTWPVGDLIGALLYPVALVLAAVAVLAIVGYLFGQKLLIPGLVCEGTDSIDAVQRAYAYVVGRPLRLVIYLVVLGFAAAVAVTIAGAMAAGITAFASGAAAHWSGERGAEILSGSASGAGGTRPLAAGIIRTLGAIPSAIAAAYALSVYATGSTVLYLLLRQVNDGQDPGELWMPGMIEGTTALTPAAGASDDDDE